MKQPIPRWTLLAIALLGIGVAGCSRDEPEPRTPAPAPKPKVVAAPAERPTQAPLAQSSEPFPLTVPPPSAPPEVLVREDLPTAGPVVDEQGAWKAGEAAFKHYATMNGFSDEATKSFFLKHIANNSDHFRLMMFGVLPGGPRYIAVKVYRDGRTEVLPDEM